jgi:ATP-dependent Clp protease ATP-binding subunit ClpB
MREAVMDTLRTRFLPEFLNRVDEVLIFHPLSQEAIHKIVVLQVERLRKMMAEKEIELEVTEGAISAIASEGYDPTYGARPLKRVIQQRLQNPLAVELLKHESVAGTQVRIDYVDGDFTFDHLSAQPAEAVR